MHPATYIVFRFLLALSVLFVPLFSQGQNMIPPTNYGGASAMRDLIHKEMQYPQEAYEQGIEGTVVLLFTVNKKGEVSGVKVWQTLESSLDQEAIRLFSKFLWLPGTLGGVPQAYEHYFRVVFKRKQFDRLCKKRGYVKKDKPTEAVDESNRLYEIKQLDDGPISKYPDGSRSYTEYMMRNMKYPEGAYKRNISGTVRVVFVVEPDGSTTNVQVTNYLGGGCSEEAVRLLSALNWTPGKVDGKCVRTKMKIEVGFTLPKTDNYGVVNQTGSGMQ